MEKNVRKFFFISVLNGLILLELTIAIYLSYSQGENMPVYFVGIFLPLVVITIFGGRIFAKRFFPQGD